MPSERQFDLALYPPSLILLQSDLQHFEWEDAV